MTTKRPSGGKLTAAARKRIMRSRDAERGIVRIDVRVPETRAPEIKEIAAQMLREAEEKKTED